MLLYGSLGDAAGGGVVVLPQAWAGDPERCRKARVPPEVAFQTKPEIALTLLDQARAWELRHRCVVADADYGDNPNVLAGLETRQERMWWGCAPLAA